MADADIITEVEIWKPIPMSQGSYEASDLGRISADNFPGSPKSHHKHEFVRQRTTKQGYVLACVSMLVFGNRRSISVHVLVADAWIGPAPAGKHINHKDGDKANNRADNLEYMTKSENQLHAYNVLGKRAKAKLTDEQVASIRADVAAGIKQRFLAKKFGVCNQTINYIVKRRFHNR